MPSLIWCIPQYGSAFRQRYGWYVKQSVLRRGVMPSALPGERVWLPDVSPPEWSKTLVEAESVERDYRSAEARYKAVFDQHYLNDDWWDATTDAADKARQLRKQREDIKRQLDNEFENACRDEFGFARIGEGWVSETMLHRLIQELFPHHKVIHHYWPEWLRGLEIDVFVPAMNLAIEYQGQQHYEPVAMWGGEDALKAQQVRDAQKASLCKEAGVVLLEVRYDDPLNREFILSLIEHAGLSVSG